MTTRLTSIAPELEISISLESQDTQRRIAHDVVLWLFNEIPQHKEILLVALLTENAEAAEKVSLQLDDEYFSMQEENKLEAAQVLFSQARMALAIVFAIRGDISETIYEAVIATGSLETVSRIVREAITSKTCRSSAPLGAS